MCCAGSHATDVLYEGVKIEFMSPITAPLIQPVDQAVIRSFKALYTLTTLQGLIEAVDEDQDGFTLKMHWLTFAIALCSRNVQQALADMKPQTITFSWKKLWLEIVNGCAGITPDKVHHSADDKIVKLAGILQKDSFYDMTSENVNGLIECHSEQLTDKDLVEMTKSASEEEDDERKKQKSVAFPLKACKTCAMS